MRTLKFTIAYDGTRFVGWQRQAAGESIQGLVEDALASLEGRPLTVHGSGRTDAGVHALGQVASATLACAHPVMTIMRAVNAQLPEDIRVTSVEDMSSDFHARFNATGKTYRYQIANEPMASPFVTRFAWHIPERLDCGAMQEAAAMLVGTHDFAAFRSTGSTPATTTRTLVQSELRLENTSVAGIPPRLLVYTVSGDGFLRHMVRAIVGTLVEIGRGQREAQSMGELIGGAPRGAAGPTAPAHGLFLVKVDY